MDAYVDFLGCFYGLMKQSKILLLQWFGQHLCFYRQDVTLHTIHCVEELGGGEPPPRPHLAPSIWVNWSGDREPGLIGRHQRQASLMLLWPNAGEISPQPRSKISRKAFPEERKL